MRHIRHGLDSKEGEPSTSKETIFVKCYIYSRLRIEPTSEFRSVNEIIRNPEPKLNKLKTGLPLPTTEFALCSVIIPGDPLLCI